MSDETVGRIEFGPVIDSGAASRSQLKRLTSQKFNRPPTDEEYATLQQRQDNDRAAFRLGIKTGIRAFAVWNDGERTIGVLKRRLADVMTDVDKGEYDHY